MKTIRISANSRIDFTGRIVNDHEYWQPYIHNHKTSYVLRLPINPNSNQMQRYFGICELNIKRFLLLFNL